MAIDYKQAGVDIEKGDALVDWLKSGDSDHPHQDKIVESIGGFASIFRMNFPEMKDPCLVSATDGVGTKLKLAIDLNRFETLGQDLVAMCANDLICTGAQPLFFLDYFATGKLDLDMAKTFLKGLREACCEAQMALLGGETAEMPGLYQGRDFDCAGFAVGVVDRPKILGAKKVEKGMVAVGLASSGFHSNGYSLIRKLYSSPEDLKAWGETLLKPTKLYVNFVMEALKTIDIAALAHITGGGIENIPRVLPKGLGLEVDFWDWPEIFKETQSRAGLSRLEMLKTFNCGVGLVAILKRQQAENFIQLAKKMGHQTFDIGEIVTSETPLVTVEKP